MKNALEWLTAALFGAYALRLIWNGLRARRIEREARLRSAMKARADLKAQALQDQFRATIKRNYGIDITRALHWESIELTPFDKYLSAVCPCPSQVEGHGGRIQIDRALVEN